MSRWRNNLMEWAASVAVFAGSTWIFGQWSQLGSISLLLGTVFWLQYKTRDRSDRSPLARFLEHAVIGIGLCLLTLGVLLYLLVLPEPPPMEPVFAAAVAVAFLLTQAPTLWPERKIRYLLLGPDPMTLAVAQGLPRGIVAEAVERLPLNRAERSADVVVVENPRSLPAGQLARLRSQGVHVWSAAAFFETHAERVRASGLRPADFFLQDNLFPFRPVMVLQAIYTNLIGLAVLLPVSPIIALFALLILMTTGGPAFERIHCVGLHSIPFELRRFRTRSGPEWKLTAVGRVIEALRIGRLPELINVVRGELALIGPRPVRAAHAARLNEVIPFHFRRFAVRPGLAGWAEANRGFDEWLEEITRLEYDLYYIKNASLLMDIEILLRLVTSAGRKAKP